MIFRTATFRLTLLFTTVLLALMAVLSVGVYVYVVSTFDFDPLVSTEAIGGVAEQSFLQLRRALIGGFVVMAVVAPIVSFGLVRMVLRPMRRSFTEQQNFVDDASHELRTPLAVIQGELELALTRRRRGEEYRRAIRGALDSTEHLITLTSDLLLLARGDLRSLSSSFGPVDLADIATASAERYQRQHIARAEATPAIQLSCPTHPVLVAGSRDLLLRAAANLVDNAVKFAMPGTAVQVRVEADGERARLVTVNGAAELRPQDRARVFDRFWRAPEARSTPGHGLGLALVRQIMEAHHGFATLIARQGHVEVTLDLPRVPSSVPGAPLSPG